MLILLAAVMRVAVLEIPSGDLSRPQAEAVTDVVRSGALSQLGSGFEILTRENLLVLLKANNLESCEGACEVETGQRIGADYVASGRVVKFGATLTLTLRLHDTHSGRLLATTKAQAQKLDELPDAAEKASRELFGAIATPKNAAEGHVGGAQTAAPSGELSVVRIESEPAGAAVRVDGELACAQTPCSRPLSPAQHDFEFQKDGFDALRTTARGPLVRATLVRANAELVVETEPPGLPVSIAGGAARAAPFTLDVPPSTVEAVIDDKCWLREGERVSLQKGEVRKLRLVGHTRTAPVRITPQDERGDALAADVLVDEKSIGLAPGTLAVPICAQAVRIVAADGRAARESVALTEGVAASLAPVLTTGGGGGLTLADVAKWPERQKLPATLQTEAALLEQLLRKTKITSPEHVVILSRLLDAYGSIALVAKDDAAAKFAWRRSVSTAEQLRDKHRDSPRRDEALLRLGIAQLALGARQDAESTFHQLIKDAPASRRLALAYCGVAETAEPKLAMQALAKAATLDDARAKAYAELRLGQLLAAQKPQEAIRHLRVAAKGEADIAQVAERELRRR